MTTQAHRDAPRWQPTAAEKAAMTEAAQRALAPEFEPDEHQMALYQTIFGPIFGRLREQSARAAAG